MRKGLRNRLLGVAVTAAVVVAVVVVALSLPGTQRALWRDVVERVESATGWHLSAATVHLRLFPGRFEAEGLTAGVAGQPPVLEVGRLEARWSWRTLLFAPHRLDLLLVKGVRWSQGAPLPVSPGGKGRGTGWEGPPRRLEIRRFHLEDAGGEAALAGVTFEAGDVQVEGSLSGGVLAVKAEARAEALRKGRRLDLGRLDLAAALTRDGLDLGRLELNGRPVTLSMNGGLRPPWETPNGAFSVRAVFPPGRLLEFWDPQLAARVRALGRLDVRGRIGLEGGRPVPELVGEGLGLSVAGLELDRLALQEASGRFVVEAEGAEWGRLRASGTPGQPVDVWLALEDARVPPRLPGMGRLPVTLPPDLRLSGTADATVNPRRPLEGVHGSVALTAGWAGGRLDLHLDGGWEELQVRELRLRLPGARALVKGRAGERLALEAEAVVDRPGALAAELAHWGIDMHLPSVPGGRLRVRGTLEGPRRRPEARVTGTWEGPSWGDLALERIDLRGKGTLRDADLEVKASGAGNTVLELSATVQPAARRGHATIRGRSRDLAVLLSAMDRPAPVGGVLELDAKASFEGAGWSLDGHALLAEGTLGSLALRTASATFSARPNHLEVRQFHVELPAGRASGSCRLTGTFPNVQAEVRLFARDLRPDVLLPASGVPLHGAAGLDLELAGPPAELEGRGRLTWQPDQEPALLGPAELFFTLAGGRLDLASSRLETAAGPLVLSATVPLGSLPRPAGIWPDAPAGAVSVRLSGCGLELVPAAKLAGLDLHIPGGWTDLEADLQLDPAQPGRASALVRLPDFHLATPLGAITPRETPVLRLEGRRLELAPVQLDGPDSRAVVGGAVDLGEATVDAAVEAELGAPLLRLALPMVRVEGPLRLRATVAGPLASPAGGLLVDHRGGRLLLQDPPVQVAGLGLEASLEGGVLSIDGGSAEVNGGHVDFGGGWDPVSGQGVVAELEDVHAVVPPGILTRWNGLVAVEPARTGRLRIAGDLELVSGIWDTPFDLLAAMADSGVTPVSVDDPLEQIDLEVEVAGRSGVLVENNLGRFQALWRRLEVGGTLARPLISGRVELLPGGRIRVGARDLAIVRGSVELPPVPGVEPELNVLTRDPAVSGGGLRTLALGDLVQAGAAAGVGRIFGLEATAIEPVRVAAETETDPAGRFTLGRRLGPHLSYFFSTNLTDTQDQTQVIQVGEWRALPGLYAQGISSTREGNGWAVLERLRWGGSPREAVEGDRLRKVRLDGDWPVARWRLLRRLGMSRGQHWEPFLAFAAAVRLERALAAYGYPEARVTPEVTGSPGERVLHLRCEPGERLHVRWEGDRVPAAVRRRVTALYSPAVPAAVSREAMRSALRRDLAVRGFPRAEVEVTDDPGGGLVVRVRRGERLELDSLVLEGVPAETARLLERWWSSPADRMALLEGREGALRRLRRLLETEGFPAAEITEVRLAPRGRRRGTVMVRIAPGPRRRVAEVRLEGEDPLSVVSRRDFPLQPGVPLRRSVMESARRRILHLYRESGYPGVTVRIGVEGAAGEGVVRVVLEPGTRRVVSGVRFTGLRHLKEKILRRGVALRPGEPLRESAVEETLAALAAFPPIEEVTVSPAAGEDERTEVIISVRERPRWTVGLGARFSSDRGQQILFELDDEDLLGRGISGRFRVRWGSSDRSAQLLLGVPPPPGGTFHLAFSSTFTHTERGDLVERDGLVTVEGWFQHGVRDQLRFYLQQRRAHLYETEPDPFFPFDVTLTFGSVGAEVILDRRDDPLDPRQGWFFSCNTAYSATALGSDLPAVRSMASLSWAFEPRPGWTLAQGVRLGAARALRGDLDPTLRFFTGGETSIRGFDQDWVGPVDCFLGRCRPAGGGALLVLNQELRVRLGDRLRGVVFADAGQVWETWSDAGTDLSLGLGAGIRLATPLGPIRLDLALPVAHKGRSSGLHVYLGIGQVF